ncbi:MAG: hypothetical protein IJE08_01380 [Clostridia bacterium]|nr:hypothetical protein [Clostridia bacterium]
MSLLNDYEQRTAWKYEPVRGCFQTADGLTNKVAWSGGYKRFPGTTVVFRLGKRETYMIRLMQSVLDCKLKDTGMLAAPLPVSALHMTLHDLVSPERCESDPADTDAYNRELAVSLERAAATVEGIRRDFGERKIRLTADRMVNMVSKSLVLMLKPQTEEDYALLMEMYGRFDGIVSLPYPLTPHITLAYYKPGQLDGDRLGEAIDFAQIRPDSAPVFEFSPMDLTAQMFRDMQNYADVPARICFCCDGGLNRSVMAANILTHMAEARGLKAVGEARAAFRGTQDCSVPQEVWDTLEAHGIRPDKAYACARRLEDEDAARFTDFAGISAAAMDRISRLDLTGEREYEAGDFFFGVRDPQYGEISYEQAFIELKERAARWLDAFEAESKLFVK